MTYVTTCITHGAVGLYELADVSVVDSATAVDQAANANGAYASGGWTGGQTGIPGMLSANAAKVTANGGWITVPDVVANRTANTFTYELWINLAALPASTSGLMGLNGNTTLFRLNTDGTFRLTLQATADVCSSTVGVPADNGWHYVACAKDGNVSTILVKDGVDVSGAVTNESMPSSSGSGYLLAKNNADNSPAATFAMFAIYPTALSTTLMLNHYQIGSNTLPVASTGVPGPPPLLGRMGR